MKILYSQIKDLIPGLKAGPKAVGEALTLTGFMMDGFSEVKFNNRRDYLLSFEVRQNRGDCLAVWGLAREVAAYYGLKAKLPRVKKITPDDGPLNIKIEAKKFVKRVVAIKLAGLKNGQSPAWLKEYLALNGLNSVNLLVDLSNYVMFLTGYPSHLIDYDKLNGGLAWSLNHYFTEVTTLFGATARLKQDNEIIIRDQKNIIALAGLVGGRAAEIDETTKTIIAEAAIYDRRIIRRNSRQLGIVTEPSHRLEKELAPHGAAAAMELLVSLVEKHTGGQVASQIFDYYPVKYVSPAIEFDPESPSRYAGIEIKSDQAIKILERLDFKIKKSDGKLLAAPPTYRQDLGLNEDLVEEIIRIYGYDKIPAGEAPKLPVVREITPKNIILAEKARDILTALGFDEILSWPLCQSGDNDLVNYQNWKTISAQNSINELYPDLRQSLAAGLLVQLNEYHKKNVEFIKIFEIGKIFGQKKGRYLEHESLGLLSATKNKSLKDFKNYLETLLRSIGFSDLKYFIPASKPKAANPDSCWEIRAREIPVGLIYKLIPGENKLNVYFAEINLNLITAELKSLNNNPAVELTRKLISLDANIELAKSEFIYKYLETLEKRFDKKNLWSLSVADVYPLGDKTRYTIRAVYQELSDQEAKKIHLAVFNLT